MVSYSWYPGLLWVGTLCVYLYTWQQRGITVLNPFAKPEAEGWSCPFYQCLSILPIHLFSILVFLLVKFPYMCLRGDNWYLLCSRELYIAPLIHCRNAYICLTHFLRFVFVIGMEKQERDLTAVCRLSVYSYGYVDICKMPVFLYKSLVWNGCMSSLNKIKIFSKLWDR